MVLSAMRRALVVLALTLPACAAERRPAPPPAEPAAGPAISPSARAVSGPRDCIVVGPETNTTAALEGVLGTGERGLAPFTLRLLAPRCVVGLPHVAIVTSVFVASTGADLRPLASGGAPLRITGEIVAGESDLGTPALVLLAGEIERLPPRARALDAP